MSSVEGALNRVTMNEDGLTRISAPKKPYRAPRVTVHGSVGEITQSKKPGVTETGGLFSGTLG